MNPNSSNYSLMIHGGAGAVPDLSPYMPSIRGILEEGQKILASGGTALDAVTECVRLLEDDPLFNAGRGSVLNSEGTIDMDAAIMNGIDISAGSVAGVKNIRNPIKLARLVMEKSQHVMMIGEGAVSFGKLHGIKMEPDEYFLTEKRLTQWQEAQKTDKVVLDHSSVQEKKMGTVGAVARDMHGNLAAATSTGGITNKRYGRVGDSPIVGAGVYADNETCAVSATGYGEQFIRTVLSKTISDLILHKGMEAEEAAKAGIEYLVRRVKGLGGVIVVDRNGGMAARFSTEAMIYGSCSDVAGINLPQA